MHPKTTVGKALAYILNGSGELLVIRHLDYPYEQVGLQAPGGTIRPGESPEAAVLREAVEETDLDGLELVADLGEDIYDITPLRQEIQHRRFFLLRAPGSHPRRWPSAELHDGLMPPTRFECFWTDLRYAHALSGGHSALIHRIGEMTQA